ncbi:MAG TPA: diacylglycerol kinase family protein [Gaiellaceae bacterium]|nr:diacylglycerol kinase family protein [Gaiellaceae bacterium]
MARRLLIVNPYASGVDERRVDAVAAALGDVDIRRTQHRGHATELVRDAADVEAIYVFSGDGGFNEALNGLERDVPLGFVPGGGASVLPRALGLPGDPVEAARILARGTTRPISLGRVNGRRFGFASGIGLDAEVVRRIDARGRSADGGRAGNVAFALTVARVLAERRGRFEPVLDIAGHGRVAFALVSNCDPYTYAGPLPVHVAPRASFERGLDLVAPREVRPVALPRFARYVLLGRGHESAPDLVYGHDLDRIEVRADSPQPLQADGEDLGDVTEALFEAERDAVRVFVP